MMAPHVIVPFWLVEIMSLMWRCRVRIHRAGCGMLVKILRPPVDFMDTFGQFTIIDNVILSGQKKIFCVLY